MVTKHRIQLSDVFDVDRGIILPIKAYRQSVLIKENWTDEFSHIGLKEAKGIIEQIRDMGYAEVMVQPEDVRRLSENGFIVDGVKRPAFRSHVTVYCPDSGRKIEEIKSFRRASGWGLKESKNFIDEMRKYNQPVTLRFANEKMVYELRQNGFIVQGWVNECFVGHEDLFTI